MTEALRITRGLLNRLVVVEAQMAAVEKALRSIFTKVNVNRVKDPDVQKILQGLAELQGAFDRIRVRPPEVKRVHHGLGGISMTLIEDERVITPDGPGTRYRVRTEDEAGVDERFMELDVPDAPGEEDESGPKEN